MFSIYIYFKYKFWPYANSSVSSLSCSHVDGHQVSIQKPSEQQLGTHPHLLYDILLAVWSSCLDQPIKGGSTETVSVSCSGSRVHDVTDGMLQFRSPFRVICRNLGHLLLFLKTSLGLSLYQATCVPAISGCEYLFSFCLPIK